MFSHKIIQELVITPAAKQCRPVGQPASDALTQHQRMSRFSFSLANMIQMTSGR